MNYLTPPWFACKKHVFFFRKYCQIFQIIILKTLLIIRLCIKCISKIWFFILTMILKQRMSLINIWNYKIYSPPCVGVYQGYKWKVKPKEQLDNLFYLH